MGENGVKRRGVFVVRSKSHPEPWSSPRETNESGSKIVIDDASEEKVEKWRPPPQEKRQSSRR
jgi:hypothetical protein